MNYATVRYAINEMYARFGYGFTKKTQAIRRHFSKMAWYRVDDSLTSDGIEARMTSTELDNLHALGRRRDALVALGQVEQ